MGHPRALERAKAFLFSHFERIFVVLLVASMLVIHYLVDEKLAFLSFYYLPIILAGFYGGRRFAVMTAGHGFAGWARPAGVLVGGVLAARKVPFLLVVLAATATTAGLRLLGVR